MRGINFLDVNHHVIDSVLMSKYNQPYSEIAEIPLESVIFLMRLAEAEGDFQESEMKKMKAKQRR